MVKTGNETNVAFTYVTEYTPADLEDLGEAGLINESLQQLFTDKTYAESGNVYAISNYTDLSVKVVPGDYWTRVYLYGKLDLDGVLETV